MRLRLRRTVAPVMSRIASSAAPATWVSPEPRIAASPAPVIADGSIACPWPAGERPGGAGDAGKGGSCELLDLGGRGR
jgi:hypothetical protein